MSRNSASKTRSDIGESRIENLHHRPIMADQVNDKRLSHAFVEGPLSEQHHDIEEVPWVLAIQGGADLPRVQLIFRKRSRLHGKFKYALGLQAQVPAFRGKERAAHDQIRLNLDRRILPLNRASAPQIGPLDLPGDNLRPRNPALDIPGDPDQGFADLAQRKIPLADRKIDKVDIDGDAWKIPDEEIDGRPALQGKDGLPIDQRQSPQEQFCLSEVHGIDHAVIPSRSTGTVI
jgi:hypothetical protein